MDNNFNGLSRGEYNEFVKRIEQEHDRTNARIKLLEEQNKQITELTISIRELAISVKQLVEYQENHESRLDVLENMDGEKWRKTVGYVTTLVIGGLVGFVLKMFGFQ